MNYLVEFEKLKKDIESGNKALTTVEYLSKIEGLLPVLSHLDGKVRDDIGWTTLASYFENKLFPSSERKKFLDILTSDEYLFYKIEKGETDSSVKRAFSVLAIGNLLWGDEEFGHELNCSDISKLTERVSSYLLSEKDERGMDKKLGWVHGIAHSGDTLSALAMHSKSTVETEKLILESIIKYILEREDRVFKWDENFRLSRPMGRAIAKLDKKNIDSILIKKITKNNLFKSKANQNLVNTFRALYIELQLEGYKGDETFEWLKSVIR